MGRWLFVIALLHSAVSSAFGDSVSSNQADFSTTINSDSSTWSYRYKPNRTRDGVYPLLPAYGDSPGSWTPANPGSWNLGLAGLPEIGMNRTGISLTNVTTSPSDAFTVASGTFWMRPGPNQMAVLEWISPFDNPNVTFEADWADLDGGGGDGGFFWMEDRSFDGKASGAAGASISNNGGAGKGSFGDGSSAIIHKGDRFDWILDPLSANADHDGVMLSITIAVVPEPSSVVLLLVGVVAIFAVLKFGLVPVNRILN